MYSFPFHTMTLNSHLTSPLPLNATCKSTGPLIASEMGPGRSAWLDATLPPSQSHPPPNDVRLAERRGRAPSAHPTSLPLQQA